MKYRTLGILEANGLEKDYNDYNVAIGAPYFTSRERGPYVVHVQNGLLIQEQQGAKVLFDTSASSNGMFIFVMSGDGTILSADKGRVLHHSAFLAGGAVAAAGTWRVRYGRLEMITDTSGHYATPTDYVEQVLTELESRGVMINTVRKHWQGASSEKVSEGLKAMGQTRMRIGNKGYEASDY